MAQSINIALAGDVMLGRLANEALLKQGPSYPWGNVLPQLHQSDLALVNLECVIAACGLPWARWPKVFHFRAAPAAVSSLELAGIDCVALANNHVLDYEQDALLEMLDLLRHSGIAYTGAGRDSEEAQRPAVLKAHGMTICVVAATDNEPGWLVTPTTPGTNWLPVSLEERSLAIVKSGVGQARAMGADLVIFSMHWGPNMVPRPSRSFRAFAHAVVELGVDVFHGHSAHVVQGVEVYRGRPIIYDAGDFVDDYAVDPVLRNDWGFLFQLHATRAGIASVELCPVLIAECQVNVATGADRRAMVERMSALSAEMGTSVHDDGQRVWIDCAPSQ